MANIYIDIDDTLGDHTSEFIIFLKEVHNINLTKQDIDNIDFRGILFSKFKLHREVVRDFHRSNNFKKISPMKESINVIQTLAKYNNLFIITGRPFDLKELTEEWVSNFFQNNFSKIYLTQQFPSIGEVKGPDKLEICKNLNCSIAIDDDPITALRMADSGMKVLLFNQPWNETLNHKNITRVFNWKEIHNLLKKEEIELQNGNTKRV